MSEHHSEFTALDPNNWTENINLDSPWLDDLIERSLTRTVTLTGFLNKPRYRNCSAKFDRETVEVTFIVVHRPEGAEIEQSEVIPFLASLDQDTLQELELQKYPLITTLTGRVIGLMTPNPVFEVLSVGNNSSNQMPQPTENATRSQPNPGQNNSSTRSILVLTND